MSFVSFYIPTDSPKVWYFIAPDVPTIFLVINKYLSICLTIYKILTSKKTALYSEIQSNQLWV